MVLGRQVRPNNDSDMKWVVYEVVLDFLRNYKVGLAREDRVRYNKCGNAPVVPVMVHLRWCQLHPWAVTPPQNKNTTPNRE